MNFSMSRRQGNAHQKCADRVAVKITHLSVTFGAQQVLNDLSFEVNPGEIFVIMGPSGSGKSVLLRHLSGLERSGKGRVLINGRDAADTAVHADMTTAFVFQSSALLNSMTVFDNLALYLREHRLYNTRTIREKVEHVLEMLSLKDAMRKYPSQLSGGMRKRVAIARALVMEPQLILYDEPTSELDPVMAATITEIIGVLSTESGVTSIVVTHDRELALTIGHRVAFLVDGGFLTIDTLMKLRNSTYSCLVDFLNPKIDIAHPHFRKPKST